MDSWCKRWVVAIIILGFVVGYVGTLWAAIDQKVGVLAAIQGDVEILHPGYKAFRAAKLYEEVLVKDRIRTGPASLAKILYDDDSITVLAENSSIEIEEYELTRQKGRIRSMIRLLKGKLRFIVIKYLVRDKANFQVRTPVAVTGVRGTDGVMTFENACSAGYHLEGTLVEFNCQAPPRTLLLEPGFWAKSCPDLCDGPFPITDEQRQELLEYFNPRGKGWPGREEEITQELFEEILPLPDREPGKFIYEPVHKEPYEPPHPLHPGHKE